MTPIEKNARRLVGVLAQYFPLGALCEDLRRRFEDETTLKNATFYAALRCAKDHRWIVGDGCKPQTYSLNSDGTWKDALKPPSLDEGLEKDRLACVVDLQAERIERLETTNRRLIGSRKAIAAGAAAGTAIGALVSIMSDPTVTMRRRLQAAENLLAYKTPQDVAEAAKLFLTSIFTDPQQNIDYRLAATTALRKSEDVRIMPAIERPSPPTPDVDPVKAAEERRAVHERRKAHLERQAQLDAEQLKREWERMGYQPPAQRGDCPENDDSPSRSEA
jgi:hypothetical protein